MRIAACVIKIGRLVVVGSALTACNPRPAHLSGIVTLEYGGLSAAGIEFVLKNGSSNKINFRGEYAKHKTADPWDTQVDCRAANGTTRYEHPVEVEADKPETIQVQPGSEARLLIWTDFIVASRGARCHLRLKLEDRTLVESGEFVP